MSKINRLTPSQRLKRITEIIESVDHRALAADGPVTPTLEEMTQKEMSEIYRLARGPITKCHKNSKSL